MNKILTACGVAFAAVSANAMLIIDPTPGSLAGTENVLFNDPGLINMGPLVQGLLNQSKAYVDFHDSGEDLFTPSGGQARVAAVDGSLLRLVAEMTDPALGIAAYQFNVNASEDGEIQIDLYESGTVTLSEKFAVSANGENWFRIFGTEGEVMSKVSFSGVCEVLDVRQNRIGAAPAPVPEPTSFAAMGIGLAMLLRRRIGK